MHITESENNQCITLHIAGRIDSATAEEAEERLGSFAVAPEKKLVMDFSELDYISSAGLRVIFNFARRLKNNGTSFAVCRAQDHVKEIFEISGFDMFIPLYGRVEEFLAK